MQNNNEITVIDRESLLASVRKTLSDGFRFVQISANRSGDKMELTYSFDLDLTLRHYRVILAEKEGVESISSVYGPAFLYENEIHDLFGIPISDISVDYRGTFYKLAVRMPYSFSSAPKSGA